MRITGGHSRGRRLQVPPHAVRPTQDRVREALFSILGQDLSGRRVLDLFAGTGAVGLGALSRGAAYVCWVEENREVRRVLEGNVAAFGEAAGRVVAGDAVAYARRWRGREPYDIVYADPPYFAPGDTPRDWAAELLDAIGESGVLAPGGVFVLESASRGHGAPGARGAPPGWRIADDRTYGRARLTFYNQEGMA